jgi:hypothetical protein
MGWFDYLRMLMGWKSQSPPPQPRVGPWFVVAQDAYQPGPLAFDHWHQARASDGFQPGTLKSDSPERLVQR